MYQETIYKGLLLSSDIKNALKYLSESNQVEEERRIRNLLSENIRSESTAKVSLICACYERYWQRIFYRQSQETTPLTKLELDSQKELLKEVNEFVEIKQLSMEEMEKYLEELFLQEGIYFMGGKTGLFYGPYIWKIDREQPFVVDVFNEEREVNVHLLDDFLLRSWLSWLSNGKYGTAGWAKEDGLYCVLEAYQHNLTSYNFLISFLKHETQHYIDYENYELSNCELEYRAKLVELHYYKSPNFLIGLIHNGDFSDENNGHPYASAVITQRLAEKLRITEHQLLEIAKKKELWQNNESKIRELAKSLFEEDTLRLLDNK